MEKIKDITKATVGDFIYHKGGLHVIKNIENTGKNYLITIDEDKIVEVSKEAFVTIFRILNR